jgi:hypothetical protein
MLSEDASTELISRIAKEIFLPTVLKVTSSLIQDLEVFSRYFKQTGSSTFYTYKLFEQIQQILEWFSGEIFQRFCSRIGLTFDQAEASNIINTAQKILKEEELIDVADLSDKSNDHDLSNIRFY